MAVSEGTVVVDQGGRGVARLLELLHGAEQYGLVGLQKPIGLLCCSGGSTGLCFTVASLGFCGAGLFKFAFESRDALQQAARISQRRRGSGRRELIGVDEIGGP